MSNTKLYRLEGISQTPLLAIAWIISVMGIIGALWLLSPELVIQAPTSPSGLFRAAASTLGLIALSLVVMSGSILTLYGIAKRKIKFVTWGLLINLVVRMYAFLVSVLAYGLDGGWISSVTMILIVLVVYLALKVQT